MRAREAPLCLLVRVCVGLVRPEPCFPFLTPPLGLCVLVQGGSGATVRS